MTQRTEPNIIEMARGTAELLKVVEPWLEAACQIEWSGSEGFRPIVFRSVLRRQYDNLSATLMLVEARRADAAVPLLRPTCEELIWCKYLAKIDPSDANVVLGTMITLGMTRDLEAQAAEASSKEMRDLGLAAYQQGFQRRKPSTERKLSDLGRQLSWPKRSVDSGRPPSVWHIARVTDSEALYRFMYHASSRYVHFSPVELARRGWGSAGHLTISASHYEPHWAAFVLCWAVRLFVQTFNELGSAIETEQDLPDIDASAMQSAVDRVVLVGRTPLMTVEELLWDS